MFNLSETIIENIIIHQLDHSDQSRLSISNEAVTNLKEHETELLLEYLLSGIMEQNEVFKFTFSNGDHTLNPLYILCTQLFEDHSSFVSTSQSIAKHLFQKSTHPNIKSGDLSIVLFDQVLYEDEMLRAIGIFKSETKDEFLQFDKMEDSYEVQSDYGLALNKLDKGCIIFETNQEDGYVLKLLNRSTSNGEAAYWKDSFLNCLQIDDSYFQTVGYMNLAKSYISHQLTEEFEMDKPDQIDLLNKSAQFFKENDSFKEKEFVEQIFFDDRIKSSFNDYKDTYQEELEVNIGDNFAISNKAVKKSIKQFKSVLKLDKNFHVYIHGDRELIEKGYDEEKGKKYYKLFYDSED